MPYRLNSINIDPDDTVSPDVEFKSTSESVAPRLNSVVMIRFQTVGGRAILITAHLADGRWFLSVPASTTRREVKWDWPDRMVASTCAALRRPAC